MVFTKLVKKMMAITLSLSMVGCGTTINFKPPEYEGSVINLNKGTYVASLTKRKDVRVDFKLDTEQKTISINGIDSKANIKDMYAKNAKDERYVYDCVVLLENGEYSSCDDRPPAKDENYVSLYHKVEGREFVPSLVYTLIGMPICIPFGTLGSLLSFSFDPIKECMPTYSDRIYSNEKTDFIGALVDRKMTEVLDVKLVEAKNSNGPEKLNEFIAEFANHAKSSEIKSDLVFRYRQRSDENRSVSDRLMAENYSSDWNDIEVAQSFVKNQNDQKLIDERLAKKNANGDESVKKRIIAFYRSVAEKSRAYADYKKVYDLTNDKVDLVACEAVAVTSADKEYVRSKLAEIAAADEAQREQARRNQFLQQAQSELKIRSNTKYGKVGQRYVPAISRSYRSTEAEYYVAGERKTIETEKYYTEGGYDENVEGYTLVYGVQNTSKKNYVAKIEISGTTTGSSYKTVQGAWSGEKRNELNKETRRLSYSKTLILRPGEEYKDQVVVGESEPKDLQIKIVKAAQVEDEWIAGFMTACNRDMASGSDAQLVLPVIENYLKDDRVDAWFDSLKTRKQLAVDIIDRSEQDILKKFIDITIETDKNYDPDFKNDVVVRVSNNSNRQYVVDVTIAKFNNTSLSVPGNSINSKTVVISGVDKSDLRVTGIRINK